MSNTNNRYGYIFKVTNKINNKIYVSKKVSSSFDDSYFGNGLKLKKAISEFGIDNFKLEVLEWCSNKDILRAREAYWINKLYARLPGVGYNNTPGGERGNRDYSNSKPFKDSTIISFQLPLEYYNILKEKAIEECCSVSFLIRRMIIEYIREGENNE